MIRHVVLLTWMTDTPAARHEAAVAALSVLPAAITQIRHYRIGSDAGINDGNADLTVIAEFLSTADYLVYRDHPEHQAAIAAHIKPILASRAALQYEFDPATD